MRDTVGPILVITLHCLVAVESFVSAALHMPPAAAVNPTTRLFAEKESLKLQASIAMTSDPLDMVNDEELRAFLESTTGRNHFLSAGGTSKVSEEPLTPEIEQLWKDACTVYYGADFLPEKGDAVVASESVIWFPGLRMENSVYSGVKLVENGDFPAYQVALIAERKRVFGAPPIVWLFNQLTGHSAEKEGKICPPSGIAKTKISVLEKDSSYCFNFDCKFEIIVEFPKLLVKILPTSKQKMEEQGSAAIRKTLEKDIIRAMESANDAFLNWKKTETKATA